MSKRHPHITSRNHSRADIQPGIYNVGKPGYWKRRRQEEEANKSRNGPVIVVKPADK